MTLRSALILPLVPLLIGTAAQAQVLETRYTELVGGRCRFVSIDKQTNEGQLKRCPGHGGAEVETLASHTRLFISYRFSRTQVARDVVEAWSAGKTVEWRGLKGTRASSPTRPSSGS